MAHLNETFYDSVKVFHRVFGHPNPDNTADIVDCNLVDFRYKLVLEEYNEFKEALAANDKIEELDGLADMLYVSYGALIAFGFSFDDLQNTQHEYYTTNLDDLILKTPQSFNNVEEIKLYYVNVIRVVMTYCFRHNYDINNIFAEVQRSNMSKSCQDLDEAIATVEKYKTDSRYNADYKIVLDKYVVYDKNTGKILKSIMFSEPNLTPFV